jgi:hypothetical protein
MATKLDKALKRELDIDGKPYMLTIDPTGLKLVEKGRRNGKEMQWKEIAGGDTAIVAALSASLDPTR